MFKNSIKSVLIAATLTVGAFAATTTSSSAEVRGGIHIKGAGFEIGFGDGFRNRRHRDNFGHRDFRRGDRANRRHRVCNPRKALRKAYRRGLNRAHIVRMGRSGIVVAGRNHGDRIVMGFGRARHCPVRFVRYR